MIGLYLPDAGDLLQGSRQSKGFLVWGSQMHPQHFFGKVLLYFLFCYVKENQKSKLISGTTVSLVCHLSQPAELVYTFGALWAQFSLAQASKHSHKTSNFVIKYEEKSDMGASHLACVVVWHGHTKGHWLSVYIRTHFCDAAVLSVSGIFAGAARACTRGQMTSFSITGQGSACLPACKWNGKRAAWRTDQLCCRQQQDELARRGCPTEIRLGFIISELLGPVKNKHTKS